MTGKHALTGITRLILNNKFDDENLLQDCLCEHLEGQRLSGSLP